MRPMSTLGLVLVLAAWPSLGATQSLPVLSSAQTATGQQPPAAPAPPAASQPAADDDTRSLFAERPRQFQIGGRLSSVEGDPARWQRYEDIRDGLLFTDARYEQVREDTGQLFRVTADKVGWRDQRYTGYYDRPGLLRVYGFWDQIPQFYSVDTKTAYTTADPGVLVLPDQTQFAIQSAQANLNAYVPISPQFDLTERRDVGRVGVRISPTVNLDLTSNFTTQRHVGELPWGASFGFGNDVEVPLPYNSRANDFNLGAEWTNQRSMLRVAYDGSWFSNNDDTLVWDSPLRRDDSTSAPGRGRMSLWPSNQAQTVSFGGYTKLARRTQLTGFLSFGNWSNDSTLQPFTINPTLTQLALPRTTTEADASIVSTNLSLVSRPVDDWRFSGRLRVYDYNNNMPETPIPQFINYDTSVTTSSTGGPELYAHSRQTFAADATWTGLAPVSLGFGYTHNGSGYDHRIFEDTSENVLTLTADAVGLQNASVRGQLEFSDRTGSGLDEALLVQIGEQPALRHYDLANRSRIKFNAMADFMPRDEWVVSGSIGVGDDDYDDSYFGLQQASFQTFGLGVDYMHPSGFGGGGSYNYERYSGFHTSRSASPGQTPDQTVDPLRDWTTDSKETVHYFSVYVSPPRFGNTEARFAYDFSDARANYVYGIQPGSPLATPSQLPEAFNKLQELRLDVRHRLNRRLIATFAYAYEPFDVFDFALDPSVINSIVQPSSLVLGYVYRPYTTHSAVLGLLYAW